METAHTIQEVRDAVNYARSQGRSIGFVPTMGALHPGHRSLIEIASGQCDFVVVSIFVNPTQFGPTEDYDKYHRDLPADEAICKAAGASLVFAPSVEEMYPEKISTWVNVEGLTDNLCGASRPGHFQGVTTVCTKLFNIVNADTAFFGQKDAQQVLVIKKMVADMNIPLQIIICPTIRESDGLALSSRNQYLTPAQRSDAPLIYKSLKNCLAQITQGQRNSKTLISEMAATMSKSPLITPEYISIVDCNTLQSVTTVENQVLIAIAAKMGDTRLIDNILVDAENL